MKTPNNDCLSLQECLDRVKRKYRLSRQEQEKMRILKRKRIISFSSTTEGGFDDETGHFYMEDRLKNFKVRITYQEDGLERFLLLMPLEE